MVTAGGGQPPVATLDDRGGGDGDEDEEEEDEDDEDEEQAAKCAEEDVERTIHIHVFMQKRGSHKRNSDASAAPPTKAAKGKAAMRSEDDTSATYERIVKIYNQSSEDVTERYPDITVFLRAATPPETLLVVDHIDPTASWSNDIKNLQFLTIAQNSMKGNGRNRTEWNGSIANDGSAIGWYGESSCASYAKLAQESWVRFREVTYDSTAYRSFVPSDEEFGGLSTLFFPRNGGEILRYKGGTFETANRTTRHAKGSPQVTVGNGQSFLVHKAVALLWGAPKRTAHAMYHSALCVDHWDGDKSNYSVDNLQWLTNRQNTLKGKNVGVADHPDWVPSHWWPLTGSPT